MSKKFTRKRIIAAVAAVSVAAVAAVAIAYWTTTATGTGSGSVSNAAAVVQLTGTITNQLHPGGSSPVTITAARDADTTLKIGQVTGTVSVDATHVTAGCSASDFSFSTPAGDQTVTNGTGSQTLTSGTASMTNSLSNQDACKGATLSIALTAGAPSAP